MTLAPQRHEEAVSKSGGQVGGGDDHCVRAHCVEKIHNLQPNVESDKKKKTGVCKRCPILVKESRRSLPRQRPSLY